MPTIYVPTTGAGSWQALPADPGKHWRPGRSAFELAVSWEAAAADGLPMPREVLDAFHAGGETSELEVLLAIPEHRVRLDNARRPSQNDLWVLATAGGRRISMSVEGKAGESFDRTLEDWNAEGSAGKTARLDFLWTLLELPTDRPRDASLRYQLFHRTASALLEARRWGAEEAVMLVQSFTPGRIGYDDFAEFAQQFGAVPDPGTVREVRAVRELGTERSIRLSLGWVDSPLASPEAVERGFRRTVTAEAAR
jgi:hypothetical protein